MSNKKTNGRRTSGRKRNKAPGLISIAVCLILAILGLIFGTSSAFDLPEPEEIINIVLGGGTEQVNGKTEIPSGSLDEIPEYAGKPYAIINDNTPFFNDADIEKSFSSYETYSELDDLGRCGICIASVGLDIMPVEDRGEIGSVKPSGWVQKKYAGLVDGNYLYNRCHLIGYQLTGENANQKNLITGTRYLNVDGMLPFENMVADYVKETGNHVLYRVTPIFEGNNPVADGVLMEARSVEDNGDGIFFCVFCYNVQPGIVIDYSTGDSRLEN